MATFKRKRRWDMLWYSSIGLIVLTGIYLYIRWVPADKVPERKWIEFAFYSLIEFAFVLPKVYWRFRRRLRLWIMLLVCLLAHVAVAVPILLQIDYSPAFYYPGIMTIESIVIMLVLWRSLHVSPDPNVEL